MEGKLMKNLLIGLLSLMAAPLTWAADVNLFPITTDYNAGAYTVGVEASVANTLDGIFTIDTDSAYNRFSLDQLQSFVPVFEYSGTTLVQMRISQVDSPSSVTVQLKFTKNALNGSTFTNDLKVTYDESLGTWEGIDPRDGKVVHSMLLITNKVLGEAVGIKEMRTQ